MEAIEELKKLYPTCLGKINEFQRLRKEIDAVPLGEFFEPVSAIAAKDDGPGELLALDAATLTSWAAHVSSGARVRMRTLEESFVAEILQKRLFPAMAMVRAHMESAAFAAYGLDRVGKCASQDNWEEMKKLIAQMLFGASYKLERKGKSLQDLLSFSDLEPVRISKMIEALDRFSEQTDQPKTFWYRIQYAMLCEYTHPTMRSMKPFYSVQKETADGWHLKYGLQESFGLDEVAMAFDMMIHSIRAGYGSALLLGTWKFEDAVDGITCEKTPLEIGAWIWATILHDPSDPKVRDFT